MTSQSSNNRLDGPIFSQCPGSNISTELAVQDKSDTAYKIFEQYSAVYLLQTDFRNNNKMSLIIHPTDYVWIFKTYGYFKTYICYAMVKTTMQINYIISNL